MTTPPPDPNTAVFPGFSRQCSPLLHLEGGGSFPSCSSHGVTQLTADKPIGQQRCQHTHLIHSRGGERPIQFIPHIKGLKCSAVI